MITKTPIQAVVNDYQARLADVGLTAADAALIARVRPNVNQEASTKIVAQKVDDKTAEVLLYDTIGFDFWTGGGFTPQGLSEQLDAMKPFENLVVRINSPGGQVFDGMTIFNILRRQDAKISVEVEGMAASAASYIAQAADKGELRISEAAQMMIHQAAGGIMMMGNADDLEAALDDYTGLIDVLRKIDGQIANIYAARSGRKPETWQKLMKAETYFTGQEAVDAKLADATISTKRPARNETKYVVNTADTLPNIGDPFPFVPSVATRLREVELDEEAA